MLFFVGLLLGIVGFAMLVVGSFAWPGQQRVSARGSRWAGVVFLLFFPLYLGARQVIKVYELDVEFNPAPVYWGLAMFLFVGGLIIVLRSTSGVPRASRPALNPFQVSEPAPATAPTPAPRTRKTPLAKSKPAPVEETPFQEAPLPKPGRSVPAENNPFDFT